MSKEEARREYRSEKRSKRREKTEGEETSRHHVTPRNGHLFLSHGLNGLNDPPRIVCPEMCCFCFDILISHLTKAQTPRSPYFTNEEL